MFTRNSLLFGCIVFVLNGLTAVKAEDNADPHAHHRQMMEQKQAVKRSMVNIELPKLKMIREDGKSIMFNDEINDGRPVVLNFIYTTCTGICPISSSLFMQLQKKLGPEADKVHLVSVSIDPEEDTPSRLREYAKRYKAGANWNHYTGTSDASIAIQVAFNVYRGNKMSHDPVTFVRTTPGKPWRRIDGFPSSDELLHDYQELMAAGG